MRKSGREKIAAILLLLFGLMFGLTGCNDHAPPNNIEDLAGMTTEALSSLLFGPTPYQQAASSTPLDKSLLVKGVYETAFLSADGKGFSDISRGLLSEKRVGDIMKRVTDDLNQRGRKRGYLVKQTPYPAEISDDKALLVTLTPTLTDVSPEVGKNRDRNPHKLLMARLTITDPKTKIVLAERLYYSGTDVSDGTQGRQLRFIKVR